MKQILSLLIIGFLIYGCCLLFNEPSPPKNRTIKKGELWIQKIGAWVCWYEIIKVENNIVWFYRSKNNSNNKIKQAPIKFFTENRHFSKIST